MHFQSLANKYARVCFINVNIAKQIAWKSIVQVEQFVLRAEDELLEFEIQTLSTQSRERQLTCRWDEGKEKFPEDGQKMH